MNNCKNCKYFYRNNNWSWDKYGKCQSTKILYGESDNRGYVVNDYKKVTDTDMLIQIDGENYSADFEVGEDFGCIHFEEKEK